MAVSNLLFDLLGSCDKRRLYLIMHIRIEILHSDDKHVTKVLVQHYFVLITPPDRMTAIMVIVEDENRDAIMLQLILLKEEEYRFILLWLNLKLLPAE